MEALANLTHNPIVFIAAIFIILDTILGLLRACKEKEFNSSAGINGAIRKAAMVAVLVALAFVDNTLSFNMAGFLPSEWLNAINLERVGLCEFFALLFVLYEGSSILKNAVLCGLPMPIKIKEKLDNWLHTMTHEMPENK